MCTYSSKDLERDYEDHLTSSMNPVPSPIGFDHSKKSERRNRAWLLNISFLSNFVGRPIKSNPKGS